MIQLILDLLKRLYPSKVSDALIDERPQSEKDKNYFDIEFAMGADDYAWKEESLADPYKIEDGGFHRYDQSSSLSCVMLALVMWTEAFAKGIGRIFIGSRKDGYSRRLNAPSGGVAMHDLIRIARQGVASEDQVPSQGLGETAMNAPYEVTKEILNTRSGNKIKSGIYVKNFNDIDNLAKASRHSPVSIFVFFDTSLQWSEFWVPFPKVINENLGLYESRASRHQITALGLHVLGGVLIDGVRHLKIQDSAGVGTGYGRNRNIRYLSEDFVKRRVYEASYAVPDVEVPPVPEKPKFGGSRLLKVTMAGNDVMELQTILQYYRFFDFPNPTGYFGGITRSGVIKLQEKFRDEILAPVGLYYGTGIIGPSTLKWLKKNHG